MSSATLLPFFGGTLSGFDPSDNTVLESTAAGSFDSAFATCSLNIGSPGPFATSPVWPNASTFWFHATHAVTVAFNPSPNTNLLKFYTSAGLLVAQVLINNSTSGYFAETFTLQTLQNNVMTTVGTSFSINIGNGAFIRQVIDLQLVAGASGSAAMYVAGTQRLSATGLSHTGWAGVGQVQLYGGLGYGLIAANCYWSEVICDSVPHVGDRLAYWQLNANSAVNIGWGGGVNNINEIPTNDNSPITAASANLISTFFQTGHSLGTYNVVAVGVSARAKCDASGPQNLQLALRTASTNYTSPTIGLNFGYQACFNPWTTNPNTGSAWLAGAAQGVEGGPKSIA